MAEETTQQTATVETEVDYAKELADLQAKRAHDDEQARLRIAVREAKKVVTEEEPDESDEIAAKVIRQLTPILNSTTQSNLIEGRLNDLSKGNDALKNLIRFHMDNTISQSLPLADRVEAAYAIANKKAIAKTVAELNIAHQNRAQMIQTGAGANQDQLSKPGANIVSDDQMKGLEVMAEKFAVAANWPAEKREANKKKFIEQALKNLTQAR